MIVADGIAEKMARSARNLAAGDEPRSSQAPDRFVYTVLQ
jgi:hypothetical protein